jgi:hypothetical protein
LKSLLNPGRIHNKGKRNTQTLHQRGWQHLQHFHLDCRVCSTDLRARISAASELPFYYLRSYFLVVCDIERKSNEDIHQVSSDYLLFFVLFNFPAVKCQHPSRSPRTDHVSRLCDLQFCYLCRFRTHDTKIRQTTCSALFILKLSLLLLPIYSVTLVYLEVVGKNFFRCAVTCMTYWTFSGQHFGRRWKRNQTDRPVRKLITESCLAEPRKSNKKYHRHGECYF